MVATLTHHGVPDDPGDGAASAAIGADVGSSGRDVGCILCPCNSALLPRYVNDATKLHQLQTTHFSKNTTTLSCTLMTQSIN
jgi:hypothetical protein